MLFKFAQSAWLFACDHAVTPILAVMIDWLEDHQWLRNPQQQCEVRLSSAMESTEDYTVWAKCAERIDTMNGLVEWQQGDDKIDSDLQLLREQAATCREVRAQQDAFQGMHVLSSWPHRGPTGLLTDDMFKYKTGTLKVVDEYMDEVEQLLHMVAKSPAVRTQDKYVFFKRISQNHGRTALMLSGGACLGMYHIGVLKALWQADLMPKVITGSSAGSIIGAFICSRAQSEIDEMFWTSSVSMTLEQMNLNLDAFDPFGPKHAMRRMVWRLLLGGALMDIGRLQECIKYNVGDITFQEAYELSGRVLNITVTSTREFKTSLVLNYLTAPNVLVRTAVCASCAVSGIFAPVELLAKNAQGEIVPYCPSRQLWCDGSINCDLPIKRIAELFNISYVIVSQVNPHVIPFLETGTDASEKGVLSRSKSMLYKLVCSELKHLTLQAYRLGFVPSALGPLIKMLDQDYMVGHINILPVHSVGEVLSCIQSPSMEYMEHCISTGQRRTWPHLTTVRYHTRLEQTLDACFDRVVLSLMNEYERISHRGGTELLGPPSPPWGCDSAASNGHRQASTITGYGSDNTMSDDGLASNPSLKPWKQDQLALWDAEEPGVIEEEMEKVRKLREAHYVLERLHTVHPAKSSRRSQCSSSVMSPSASTLDGARTLSDFTRWHFPVPQHSELGLSPLQVSSQVSGIHLSKKLQGSLYQMPNPPLKGMSSNMSLPAVLDWIEANVQPEHKMKVAQFAMDHHSDLAAIIQSVFDKKEELILAMLVGQPEPLSLQLA